MVRLCGGLRVVVLHKWYGVMCVVGYASRGAVMCGEPVVGFLLCDKERLCGIGWIRLCGSVGLCVG